MNSKTRLEKLEAKVGGSRGPVRTPEEKALVDQYYDILIGNICEDRSGRDPPKKLVRAVEKIWRDKPEPPPSPAFEAFWQYLTEALDKSLGAEQPEERKAVLPIHVRPPSERPKPQAEKEKAPDRTGIERQREYLKKLGQPKDRAR